jgi:hypothetical protein
MEPCICDGRMKQLCTSKYTVRYQLQVLAKCSVDTCKEKQLLLVSTNNWRNRELWLVLWFIETSYVFAQPLLLTSSPAAMFVYLVHEKVKTEKSCVLLIYESRECILILSTGFHLHSPASPYSLEISKVWDSANCSVFHFLCSSSTWQLWYSCHAEGQHAI